MKNSNSMQFRIIALFLGLFIDAYGNSLNIITNYGNGIWTAVAINFNQLFGFSIPWTLFWFGIANIGFNLILIRKFDLWRIVSGIIYMAFFSYFIDLFNILNGWLGIDELGPVASFIISLFGLVLVGISISFYQRANLLMHPNDDTTNILRFKYFHGSAIKSQFADMGIFALIIIVCSLIMHQVVGVGIITVFFFFTLGPLIKYSDVLFLPSLKHNLSPNDEA
ncbi:hypothetical protein ACYATP_08020 [Lactobacillaceae bacterium Melli_B4]